MTVIISAGAVRLGSASAMGSYHGETPLITTCSGPGTGNAVLFFGSKPRRSTACISVVRAWDELGG